MSPKRKQLMEYITQDIVAMLVERCDLDIQDAMRIVYHSTFHKKLLDEETGYYLEGSEYLYSILKEELERTCKDYTRWHLLHFDEEKSVCEIAEENDLVK